MKYAISAEQSRAARALLGWSRDDLARVSGLPARTLADFELGNTKPHARTVAKLVATFEDAGVILINRNGGGVGVRLRAAN